MQPPHVCLPPTVHAYPGCTGGRSGRGRCPGCRSPPAWSRGPPRTSPTPARCHTAAASTPTPTTNIFIFFTLTQITVTCPLTLLGSHLRPPPRHLPPHRSSTLVTANPARPPSLCRWPSQSPDPGLDTASGPLRVCCWVEADILCDNGALTEGELGLKGWAFSDHFAGEDSCLESIFCGKDGFLSSEEQDQEFPLVGKFLG